MCSGDYVPERFTKKEKIGEGAYGIVIKAWDRQRNTEVALKKIKNVQSMQSGSSVRSAQDRSSIAPMSSHHDGTGTGLPHFIIREISALVDMRGNANIV